MATKNTGQWERGAGCNEGEGEEFKIENVKLKMQLALLYIFNFEFDIPKTLDQLPHWLAAEEVNMEMIDDLPTVSASIDDHLIPTLIDSFLFCKQGRPVQQPTQKLAVVGCGSRQRRQVSFGNNQEVYPGFGIDVTNGHEFAVLKHHIARLTFLRNVAKQTVHEC